MANWSNEEKLEKMNLVKKSKNLMIYWDEAVYGKTQAKVATKKIQYRATC